MVSMFFLLLEKTRYVPWADHDGIFLIRMSSSLAKMRPARVLGLCLEIPADSWYESVECTPALPATPQGVSMKTNGYDGFLEKRLVRYDEWLRDGKIAYSSRVIPVSESINAKQHIFPTERALEILGKARKIALQNCECRTHYKRCDKPLEVCFILNEVADKYVSQGRGRYATLNEAESVLRQANESGLVHLSLYMPDHEIFALCSCCPCCCHDLQILREYDRPDLVVRSEFVAVTDGTECTHCGACVDRCPFHARVLGNGKMEYTPDKCLGCGLCVTVCPAGATSMELLPSAKI
jgi:ferredoxin